MPCIAFSYGHLIQAPYNVVRYQMTGSNSAFSFFQVDEVTGVVTLKRPLYTDSSNVTSYSVSSITYYSLIRSFKVVASDLLSPPYRASDLSYHLTLPCNTIYILLP